MSGYQSHANFIKGAKKAEAAIKAKQNAAAAKAQQEKIASYMGTPSLTPAGLPSKKPAYDPTSWWGGKRHTRNRRRVNRKRKGTRRA